MVNKLLFYVSILLLLITNLAYSAATIINHDNESNNNKLTLQLFEAIKEADLEKIQKLIDAGADVNGQIEETGLLSRTLFYYNSEYQSLTDHLVSYIGITLFKALQIERVGYDIIELLLKNGADVDILHDSGCSTPLSDIIWLKKNLNRTLLEYQGNGPFHADNSKEANRLKKTLSKKILWVKKIIKDFIKKSKKIDIITRQGTTALIDAVISNDIDTVNDLLDKGANLDIKPDGKTVLDMAKEKKYNEIINAIEENARFRPIAIKMRQADVARSISCAIRNFPDVISQLIANYETADYKDFIEYMNS